MLHIDDRLLARAMFEGAQGRDSDAFALVARFGDLAPWLLSVALREKAARYRRPQDAEEDVDHILSVPQLRPVTGSFGILCVVDFDDAWQCVTPDRSTKTGVAPSQYAPSGTPRPNPPYGLFDAFVLPLRWVRLEANEPQAGMKRLPGSLRLFANRVLQQILSFRGDGPVDGGSPDNWDLTLGVDEPENYDLSQLVLFDSAASWESGWASMAAALLLAYRGGVPNSSVAASAAWKDADQSADNVIGLASKVDAAKRHGMKTLFVAQSQVVPDNEPAGMDISRLNFDLPNPLHVLRPLLKQLYVQVESNDLPGMSRYFWFLRKLVSRDEADLYYAEKMLPRIVARCRRELTAEQLKQITGSHLIGVVSHNYLLATLNILIVQPCCVQLIVTPESRGYESHVKVLVDRQLQNLKLPPCEFETSLEIASNQPPDQIVELETLHRFSRESQNLVFDLTSGPTLIKVSLMLLREKFPATAFVLHCEDTGELAHGNEQVFML